MTAFLAAAMSVDALAQRGSAAQGRSAAHSGHKPQHRGAQSPKGELGGPVPLVYWYPAPYYPTPYYEAAAGWWYYCPDYRAYHPYVADCPSGWQAVTPHY